MMEAAASSVMPRDVNSAATAAAGTLSNLSTATHARPNASAGTPAAAMTPVSTFLDDTLRTTSAGVRPTRVKNETMAAKSSASAATPSTPTMSMFH